MSENLQDLPRYAGAQWQAGVTPGSEKLRPFLDGVPADGAIAASIKGGWVICREDVLRTDNTFLSSRTVVRRGAVTLHPCDDWRW